MGKPDDSNPRITREFDPSRLAALTKEPFPDDHVTGEQEAVVEDRITFARAETIDDPLTTGLLAEVARTSQTAEFDDETIEEAKSKATAKGAEARARNAADTLHPHTRRRSS